MKAKRMKIETQGNQVFNVPNDEEGRVFLRLLRKYMNRPRWCFRVRGRGPRKKAGDARVSFSRSLGIPQAESEWLAVYIGYDDTGYGRFAGLQQITGRESWKLSQIRREIAVKKAAKNDKEHQEIQAKQRELDIRRQIADDIRQEVAQGALGKLAQAHEIDLDIAQAREPERLGAAELNGEFAQLIPEAPKMGFDEPGQPIQQMVPKFDGDEVDLSPEEAKLLGRALKAAQIQAYRARWTTRETMALVALTKKLA
jgi:hypothetical protein